MWIYHQDTGALCFEDGVERVEVSRGYSGFPPWVNAPDAQDRVGQGPIPRGRWTIGPAYHHATLGPLTMNLEPMGQVFGRTVFRIHGDSVANPGYASHGCIVIDHGAREILSASADRDLRVCLSTDVDEEPGHGT